MSLPGKDNHTDEFLCAKFSEPLFSDLIVQGVHKIQDGLASENFVAHICAKHDASLVLQNGSGEAGPNHQPVKTTKKNHSKFTLDIRLLSFKPTLMSQTSSAKATICNSNSETCFMWVVLNPGPRVRLIPLKLIVSSHTKQNHLLGFAIPDL